MNISMNKNFIDYIIFINIYRRNQNVLEFCYRFHVSFNNEEVTRFNIVHIVQQCYNNSDIYYNIVKILSTDYQIITD